MEVSTYIALGGLIVTIIINIVLLTWSIANIRLDLTTKIAAAKDEMENQINASIKMYGETITAIRQKINDVELYGSKEYVRREGFYKVQETLTKDIKTLGDKLDAGLQRVNDKLDNMKG